MTCQNLLSWDFKNLPRRTVSDKLLRNKAFNIGINPKYDGNRRGLASMAYKLLDKNSSGSVVKNELCPTSVLRT